MLLKYTDNHPDVVALKATIERLKTQREAAGQSTTRSVADPLDLNPVYQRMKIGLGETEVEIAALKSKLAAAEATVNDLRKRVDTIPEIERQLSALNRDYEVMRAQYETLLERRESLRITGEVEQTGDQLQFRIIDPPRAALMPVGPNRPLSPRCAATVVCNGILGVALAFLLQQLNPVFTNRHELRRVHRPARVGPISFVRDAEDKSLMRRRALVFAGVFGALPIGLGFAVLLQAHIHRAVVGILSGLPL